MQELLQELHISFSELPEQKIMLQPALEEPKEQTTAEAPILEDALPTQPSPPSPATTTPPETTTTTTPPQTPPSDTSPEETESPPESEEPPTIG